MSAGILGKAWAVAAFWAGAIAAGAAFAENAPAEDWLAGGAGYEQAETADASAQKPAQDGPGQERATSGDQHLQIPACANDPDKLGISRVVEIDTAGGPIFGGSHAYNSFLGDHEVVLTFDDGPMRAYTRRILKALEDHCTRATFFMVGRMAVADPAMVREVIAAGHTAGTHTYAHRNLKTIGLLKARSDFELGYSAVTKAAGQPVAPLFRFPYLSESRQMLDHLKKRNMASFFIDVDSKDYQTRNPDVVFKRIMSQLDVTHKGIILMHDIQPSTAGVIDRLLDALHDRGYKVVHVVPKASEPTLAEFDVPAAQALAAKGNNKTPLADRAMTWTMPSKDKAAGKTSPAAAHPATASNEADHLPWTKPAAKAHRATSSPRPSNNARPQHNELPWQTRTFAN
ncbi:MAG TPA: polysaccharide deacetylase family protein [Hyphomicrobium sp.]|nr:polysaccharide deacetylase family protein [Hyphomicrobium sp.]